MERQGMRGYTDQRGRWSLPARMVFAGGWGLAVGGRPEGGRVDLLTSGQVGKGNRRGTATGSGTWRCPWPRAAVRGWRLAVRSMRS